VLYLERLRSKSLTWAQYQVERTKLEAEAWNTLLGLKAKYDGKFDELKERVKAYF